MSTVAYLATLPFALVGWALVRVYRAMRPERPSLLVSHIAALNLRPKLQVLKGGKQ